MASNRIVGDRAKLMFQRITDAAAQGALFRMKMQELLYDVGGYNGDASFQTDTGMSAADQTKFVSLLTNSVAELFNLTNVAVALGGQTNVRQFLDQISTGG